MRSGSSLRASGALETSVDDFGVAAVSADFLASAILDWSAVIFAWSAVACGHMKKAVMTSAAQARPAANAMTTLVHGVGVQEVRIRECSGGVSRFAAIADFLATGFCPPCNANRAMPS